jgi:hypothetical protein
MWGIKFLAPTQRQSCNALYPWFLPFLNMRKPFFFTVKKFLRSNHKVDWEHQPSTSMLELWCSSAVECLPSVHEAQGLIHSTEKKKVYCEWKNSSECICILSSTVPIENMYIQIMCIYIYTHSHVYGTYICMYTYVYVCVECRKLLLCHFPLRGPHRRNFSLTVITENFSIWSREKGL